VTSTRAVEMRLLVVDLARLDVDSLIRFSFLSAGGLVSESTSLRLSGEKTSRIGPAGGFSCFAERDWTGLERIWESDRTLQVV
jgi:hypothetical protein